MRFLWIKNNEGYLSLTFIDLSIIIHFLVIYTNHIALRRESQCLNSSNIIRIHKIVSTNIQLSVMLYILIIRVTPSYKKLIYNIYDY
jgi:hypothetical protein